MTTKSTTARKPAAKKPVAKKATTATKTTAKKAVAKKPVATKKPSTATRRTTSTPGLGVTREALLKKLVKLSSSKQDAVALDATKTLLTYVK